MHTTRIPGRCFLASRADRAPPRGDRAAAPPREGLFLSRSQTPTRKSRTMTEERQETPAAATYDVPTYDVPAVQDKWRKVWDDLDPFRADDDEGAEKRYALTMFPYPSGDLHMGHAEVIALHDVIARYWWQQGYDVLNPIGLGLLRAARRERRDPQRRAPGDVHLRQHRDPGGVVPRYAVSFDWSRRLQHLRPGVLPVDAVAVPEVPRARAGLPQEQPGQLVPERPDRAGQRAGRRGMCERCGAEVTKRELTQWYFKITEYAQRLLDDMDRWRHLAGPGDPAMQRNWIGRSEGAHVHFAIEGRDEPMTVFTTRPDTLFGATFMVVAADAPLAAELVTDEQRPALRGLPGRGPQGHRDRAAGHRPAEDRRLPGRARDQPGHRRADPGLGRRLRAGRLRHRRDHGGARPGPARLGVRRRRSTCRSCGPSSRPRTSRARRTPATARRSTPPRRDQPGRAGRRRGQARGSSTGWSSKGLGTRHGQLPAARLAAEPAALLGRPIPIIHCPSTARSPVPDDQLPVELPELRGADLKPKGVSPLAAAREWVDVDCPKCGGPAERDTDTMDTFVDSSWYFLRYLSPDYDRRPFDLGGRPALDAGVDSTSAASSTRSCTCCTRASSPRRCTTWACSTSSSRSPR